VARAKPSGASPHKTPVRAGRVVSAPVLTTVSPRRALLWAAALLFALVWLMRDLVLLVGFSILIAYALLPVVAALQRPFGRRGPRLPRSAAAAIVMLALVSVLGWLLALAAPRLVDQAARFAAAAPGVLTRLVEGVRSYGAARGFSSWLDPAIDNLLALGPELLQNLAVTAAGWAGRGLDTVGQVLGLLLLPWLAFYLLTDATAIRDSALRFIPASAHGEIQRLGQAIDRALRSYVRGQAIVCLVMGIAVGSVLALLGSPVALLLGLIVGLAELVPYVGFLAAAIAIALAGFSVDPAHAVAGVGAYFVINWAIGTFVAPQVMGRYLKMHPFIVTVSVLAGTQLFGAAGAILALPGAAMIQAAIGAMTAPATPEGPAVRAAEPSSGDEHP
jgi:predicted PurR-regulated permease PerM